MIQHLILVSVVRMNLVDIRIKNIRLVRVLSFFQRKRNSTQAPLLRSPIDAPHMECRRHHFLEILRYYIFILVVKSRLRT